MYKGIVSWNGDLEKRELYHSELWADMSILNAKLLIIIKFHVLQDLAKINILVVEEHNGAQYTVWPINASVNSSCAQLSPVLDN